MRALDCGGRREQCNQAWVNAATLSGGSVVGLPEVRHQIAGSHAKCIEGARSAAPGSGGSMERRRQLLKGPTSQPERREPAEAEEEEQEEGEREREESAPEESQQQQVVEAPDDTQSVISTNPLDAVQPGEEPSENEETRHERAHKQRLESRHHHHHHRHHAPHIKEFIKADRSSRLPRAGAPVGSQDRPPVQRPVATVVDEEQLHERLVRSKSADSRPPPPVAASSESGASEPAPGKEAAALQSLSTSSSTSSSGGSRKLRPRHSDERSPPPAAIIIPAHVAAKSESRSRSPSQASGGGGAGLRGETSSTGSGASYSAGPLTREQLEYGSLLRNGEVQVLYRNYDTESSQDRALKDEQARLVAPGLKQSPVAIMSMNPTYRLTNKPLTLDYPNTIENVRLNNTGFSWEVKIPYQITINTALHGAHLHSGQYYRLDHFHCHWGPTEARGSEHTIDGRSYSAELHFVHYNMEKYHSIAKAARHPDGLAVLAVFLEAQAGHRKHAELDKVAGQLRLVSLKGEHALLKQPLRLSNLLPANRSYWSYQGSLTTPPYLESVTWFILKQPLRCSASQIDSFRSLSTALARDSAAPELIRSNHRQPQPLNGRTIVTYDEPHPARAAGH